MTAKIATPVFDEGVRYEDYVTEITAWQVVTNIERDKQALVLVLALGEMKREILENIPLEDLKVATGVQTYLQYLKSKYAKD